MKNHTCFLLAAALIAGGCQSAPDTANRAATSDITVNFQDSDKFTDVRETANGPTSQYILHELSKYLREVAARRLTAGEKLVVTFTDIDLAGDITPGQQDNIRFMKAVYIPRMKFHFQLQDASGAVIKEGDRNLSDLNYQQTALPISQSDSLRYDKPLLADWVRQEFRPSP